MNEPKTLVYDIETTPVLAWVWRCGDQTVRHAQLHEDYNETKIICITYRWLHEKRAKALVFDIENQCDREICEKFDELLKKADIVIGKNSDRFDNKHINMRRFIHGLPPMPDWTKSTDDLEKQMRRHFNMQSFALDYFDKICGGTGKISMKLDDWIQIVQYKNKSRLAKMVKYGKKDADDTAELIKEVWPYVSPKFNHAAHHGDRRCVNCGSTDIVKDREATHGGSRVVIWKCNAHGGSAGRSTILKDGRLGKQKR